MFYRHTYLACLACATFVSSTDTPTWPA